MRKQYIEVPLKISGNYFSMLWIHFKGIILSPLYLLMAKIAGAPGIGFHLRCAATGVNLFFTGRASLNICYNLIFSPMDSTRYFEFHKVWLSLKSYRFTHYLDVSSPRLMPLLLLKAASKATATLLNPDSSDLQATEKLSNALGLSSRCTFFNGVLDKAGFKPASFDLITCISVLEHVPQDQAAVKMMWSLLRPGGKLILTLPCMAKPLEQYISNNPWGILNPENNGYTFWQRYYDLERIESIIYRITGMPDCVAIYGEKENGFFFRNASMKRLFGSRYPFWREPYMMAIEYQPYTSIDELPGEGVAMLAFTKPEVNK